MTPHGSRGANLTGPRSTGESKPEVTLPVDAASAGSVTALLERATAKGLRLWLEDGQLRFRAPEGALTADEFAQLRQTRAQIMACLQAADLPESPANRGLSRRLNRAPLSFSQLQHWHFYRLGDRPAMRHIAAANRLRGKLDIAWLRASVSEVVRRHEALRTRVVMENGLPLQEIDPPSGCALGVDDLSSLRPQQREQEARRTIEALIREPIDVAVGPLFETRLLKMSQDDHIFIVVLEHLVSDMWSLGVLLREIFGAYSKLSMRQPLELPSVSVQFPDYASWQRCHEGAWLESHGRYWHERLAGCGRLRFPADQRPMQTSAGGAWGMVPASIGAARTAELNAWCQSNGTTTALCAFAAYTVLVLRWCDASETVIRFEINGRTSQELENTIGYFAAPLYLRVKLLKEDSFMDVLERVTEEFCTATDHADSSYLEARLPRPEYSRNTAFNWVPESSDMGEVQRLALAAGLECSPLPFVNPLLTQGGRDTEPFVLFGADALSTLGHTVRAQGAIGNTARTYECSGIAGGVYFPLRRFSTSTMQCFANNYLLLIDRLTTQPGMRVNETRLR